jgi:hypothetical protein
MKKQIYRVIDMIINPILNFKIGFINMFVGRDKLPTKNNLINHIWKVYFSCFNPKSKGA